MEPRKIIDLTYMYKDSFRKCAVNDCETIEEFLQKYYKDKYEEYLKQGCDCSREEYLSFLIYVYKMYYRDNGYIVIFANSSKIGKDVSFFNGVSNL